VVSTPLKNMSSSVGIIIPNILKIQNVPNHQPVAYGENDYGGLDINPLHESRHFGVPRSPQRMILKVLISKWVFDYNVHTWWLEYEQICVIY
jgi:hypothetical protein